MKRKAYQKMLEWKEQWAGSTALMIEGARRVGKSYLCREFAENEYRTHIIIDFANVSPQIIDLFEQESSDLDLFLQNFLPFIIRLFIIVTV